MTEGNATKNFGFVVDNRSCIGCHACSTACKAENEVPLGVYRTWVKSTETGTYPDTRRHFQVTRCNHCANPPCVRICPTEAMYQREDGIVEFDSSACIGCKGCLQACPYDAIHIDPGSGTAAKCHYCSHRTDIGLEPACVVVCPEHAIIAGDMNDPESEISRVLGREQVTVRKPEQGTAPKLFYIEGAAANLHPTATERTPVTFAMTDVLSLHPEEGHGHAVGSTASDPVRTGRAGQALRGGQPQGLPTAGPIQIGGRRAGHMVQVAYNAQHKVPWHWPVPAYLVTKGVAAGVVLLFAWLFLVAGYELSPAFGAVAAGLSLGMLLTTTALLVFDLERPERFLYILLRPQWGSWLTRGAVVLIGFSITTTAWLALEFSAALSWVSLEQLDAIRLPLLLVSVPLAIAAAVYTAFLFGQAEGRDLWQSPLLPVHLLVQALMMGAASLLLMAPLVGLDAGVTGFVSSCLVASLVLDLLVMGLGEFGMPHASEVAALAAHAITHGRYARTFWLGAIGVGHVLPLLLIATGSLPAILVASVCAVVGLYCFEYAFVMAPQEVPNS